ncbi:MAG: radical SAM protein [Deltaproteobacteria bacterium]|nr:radical SAM protein [Deltaproteobacteria bacterium]
MSRSTYVFPRQGGLVVFKGEQATLLEPGTGWASTLSGELAIDARALLEKGVASPRLLALAESHPGVRALVALADSESISGQPDSALRLDGFGTLFVELVGRCNEKCTHCYASSGPEITAALPREACESIVDDCASLGFDRIQFTGGDPLLCRFLPALVERAAEVGIPQIEIYTNGLALAPSLLAALAPSRPSFAVSFYSSRAEVHEGITQTPGSHRRTSDAIRRVVEAGLGIRVGIIAMPENAADVADTVEYVRELGVESIAVSPMFEVGRGGAFELDSLPALGNAHGGAVSAEPDPRVKGKMCVTYDGDVVPCIFNRDMVLGSIREQRLSAIAASPKRQPRRLLGRDQFLQQCGASLQCSGCKMTACALHFGGEA